jgi:hypothetical protein
MLAFVDRMAHGSTPTGPLQKVQIWFSSEAAIGLPQHLFRCHWLRPLIGVVKG